ncbi:ankyrin repeat domain-containing protein [Candidatus Dependentiae bacterium]
MKCSKLTFCMFILFGFSSFNFNTLAFNNSTNKNSSQNPPFEKALLNEKGALGLIQEISKQIHDLIDDDEDKQLKNIIYRAIEKGDLELVKLIISNANNAKINYNAMLATSFMWGDEIYRCDGIEYQQYGPFRKFCRNACTPLTLACLCGHYQIAKYLIEEKGASVSLFDPLRSPISAAKTSRSFDIIKLLRDNGLDFKNTSLIEEIDCRDVEMLEVLLKYGAKESLNKKNRYFGQTYLHRACKKENMNLETIQLLIKYGADPTLKDGYGKMPLDYALDYAREHVNKKHGVEWLFLAITGLLFKDEIVGYLEKEMKKRENLKVVRKCEGKISAIDKKIKQKKQIREKKNKEIGKKKREGKPKPLIYGSAATFALGLSIYLFHKLNKQNNSDLKYQHNKNKDRDPKNKNWKKSHPKNNKRCYSTYIANYTPTPQKKYDFKNYEKLPIIQNFGVSQKYIKKFATKLNFKPDNYKIGPIGGSKIMNFVGKYLPMVRKILKK